MHDEQYSDDRCHDYRQPDERAMRVRLLRIGSS
jgi:hypothetical protein